MDVAEIRLRIRLHHLDAFLRDGRYRTQFEVSHSGGAYGRGRRMVVEHTLFGVPPSCIAQHRPVYGYLTGSDEAGQIGQYGEVIVRLGASVRARTTFVVGDSLDFALWRSPNPAFVPQPVIRPNRLAIIAPIDPLDCVGLGDASPQPYRYAEAQIYGGVRISDVSQFVYTLGTGPDPATAARLRSLGISWQSV